MRFVKVFDRPQRRLGRADSVATVLSISYVTLLDKYERMLYLNNRYLV